MNGNQSLPRFRWLLLVVAPLALFGAAACGGGDDDRAATQSATTAGTGAGTVAGTPATGTARATTTATASPANTSPPVTDGTVDPLGAADVRPVTTKPDSEAARPQPTLKDVRTGVHPEEGGWERIVFEFQGGLPGSRIEYIASATQCGSGQEVDVGGEAILQVRFENAAAHTQQGQPTFRQEVDGAGDTIEEAKQTCDFEGVVSWAIAIDRGQQPYKVTTLTNPPRLVIDVKR